MSKVHDLVALDLVVGEGEGRGKRRTRRPTLARAIKQAEKDGKTVTSITTPDGYTLRFGEPQTEPPSDLDKWLAKRNAH